MKVSVFNQALILTSIRCRNGGDYFVSSCPVWTDLENRPDDCST
jgi:hypothetical protein